MKWLGFDKSGMDLQKELISKYKQEKCRLAIFITGKENYPEVLKKIVMKQVELNNNVC